MRRIPLENLERIAKLIAVSDAPRHVKESIWRVVRKYVEGSVDEKIVRLRVSWLAAFSFRPNLEIIRFILQLLGLEVKHLERWGCRGEVYARLVEYENRINRLKESLGLVEGERLTLDQIFRARELLSLEG